MSPEAVLAIGREAIQITLLVSLPLLLASLAAGLLVSIFQAATQINESTLSFIPKLLVLFGVLIWLGPWILVQLIEYTQRIIRSIPGFIA